MDATPSKSTSRIPATVITGFLGAGKTSLVRHLLENAGGRRIALIINEFGDIGVDGEILKACGEEVCGEDDIVELANGCICCTVADDFLPAIEALLDRPEPPDHIVIETSGLALPKPLVLAFNWPEVRTRVTVDGVVAVVDGPAVAAGLFAADPAAVDAQRADDDNLDHESPLEELFEDQLLCADMVILNKTDLMNADELRRVTENVIAKARDAVHIVPTSHGAIDINVLLGITAAVEDDIDNRRSHHDDEEGHEHDDFESFIVDVAAADTAENLAARVQAAMRDYGVLRVKGFAAVTGKDMRLVVQGVGPRVQHYFDRDWAAGENRAGRLVVIGESGLDQSAITAALQG